jgi:hypothetical protein
LLWRSCRGPDIEGQLPAMWPLLVNCPQIWGLKVLFRDRGRLLWTPHMSSILWLIGYRKVDVRGVILHGARAADVFMDESE